MVFSKIKKPKLTFRRVSTVGSVDKKDTCYKRGQKSLKYRKPAVRDLLTAGVVRVEL